MEADASATRGCAMVADIDSIQHFWAGALSTLGASNRQHDPYSVIVRSWPWVSSMLLTVSRCRPRPRCAAVAVVE
jgi:hypothetical protein